MGSVKVTKEWDDNGNASGRPASLIFDAFIGSGTTSVGNCTATAAGSWKCKINNLAKLDSSGNAISYTIKERTVPDNYAQTVAVVSTEAGTTATVRNTLQKQTITVIKQFIDDDNRDGWRPKSDPVYFILRRD